MITKVDIDDDSVVGRLGNKLFQIAAGYSIAKEGMMKFQIPVWKYITAFPNVPCGSKQQFTSIYSEPAFTYSKPPVDYLHGTVHINGYFQSDKYFYSREDILNLFEFGDSIKSTGDKWIVYNNIDVSKYVAIHVRRGDYVNLPHFYTQLVNTEYYNDCIIMCGSKKFLVFSDDISFCMEYFSQFQGMEFQYSAGNSEVVDMYLMSKCKGNIIANSSFSWWGAYLNKNSEFTYAPKSWFECGIDSKDLYVKGWRVV